MDSEENKREYGRKVEQIIENQAEKSETNSEKNTAIRKLTVDPAPAGFDFKKSDQSLPSSFNFVCEKTSNVFIFGDVRNQLMETVRQDRVNAYSDNRSEKDREEDFIS